MLSSCLILAALAAGDPEPPLADRVVSFAESKLGSKVGDGRCSALIREAFSEAGAARRRGWGDPVDSAIDARPGDVLEFKGAIVVQPRIIRGRVAGMQALRMEHHVAIVSHVERRGDAVRFALLHQNAGPAGAADHQRQHVQRWLFRPEDLRRGTMAIYRPVPDDAPPDASPPFGFDLDFEDEDGAEDENDDPPPDGPPRRLSPLDAGW
jgi:hypothetical protein